jgi:hypothetical protein
MTTPDPGRETKLVPIGGRNIVVRELTDAQMALLMRESDILKRKDIDTERKLKTVSLMFKVLQSAVVQEEDREFVDEQIAIGDLGLREMMDFILVFTEDEADEKPKVRRARTPAKRS